MKYADFVRQEREYLEAAVAAIIDTCHQKVRVDDVVAHALDRHTCPSLYMRWTAEKFWGLQVPKLLTDLERIHKELKRRGAGEDNPVVFNDLDDRVFFLQSDKRVIAHTSQNYNLLFIWKDQNPGYRKVHVRRYYDVWNPQGLFFQEEDQKFRALVAEGGYRAGISHSRYLDLYADDYPEVSYPKRLSLASYKRDDFGVRYGDCRDVGYVLSGDENNLRVDRPMETFGIIETVLECFVPSVLCELFDKDGVSAVDTSREKPFDSQVSLPKFEAP